VRLAASYLGFLSFLCFACGSRAAIFDADDRQYVSTAPGSVYSPIGMVSGSELWRARRGTGFLVDECDVLTAQHIVYDDDHPLGKRLKFVGAPGTPEQMASFGTVVAAGGLPADTAEQQSGQRDRDWMLLRLDRCLGASLGYVKLNDQEPGAADGVQNAGYPDDRNWRKGLTIDPSCEITDTFSRSVRGTSCAALPGNSGGPVFRIVRADGRPRLEVMAIVVAGYNWRRPVAYRADLSNWTVPVEAILPRIRPFIASSAFVFEAAKSAAPAPWFRAGTESSGSIAKASVP